MCERDGRLIAHHVYNELMSICVCFVWSVFVENAQEMVMMIGSCRGMQHDDVVKRKSQKDTQRMFVQGNPKRNKQECENGNDVCASVQLATTCVCKKACCDNQKDGQMNDGGRTDTETPDKREPVLARPERDAHQETAEEDVVCGAKAGRMC